MFKKSKKTKAEAKPAEVKYCKDCTYYDDSEEGEPVCKSPQRGKVTVTGKYIKKECWFARETLHNCGPEAKWFKDKGTTCTITYYGGAVTLSDYINKYGSQPKE